MWLDCYSEYGWILGESPGETSFVFLYRSTHPLGMVGGYVLSVKGVLAASIVVNGLWRQVYLT